MAEHRPHRNQILHSHLQQLAIRDRTSKLAAGLTYENAIDLCSSGTDDDDTQPAQPSHLPGGLSKEDVMRFAYTPLKLDTRTQAHLQDALRKTLNSFFDVWAAGQGKPSPSHQQPIDYIPPNQRASRALQLASEIHSQKQRTQETRDTISTTRRNISSLVNEINEIHPRLESNLLALLTAHGPGTHAQRTLRAEVLANTVEACLLKLSLLRYRSYSALYGFSSSSDEGEGGEGERSMTKALTETHTLLRRKDVAQREEERELDRQLAEYEAVMQQRLSRTCAHVVF
ncbi:hypothetical protein EIP91_007961 [Steccherinum ochraceum]|uniref:Uncharacterized protein n=1 Tax=Steccherinum ochraceum TaxID=92696 RepID=A0A4R0R691_9APHY|nr:hypothetical protein EIP91_007961 [Steccherinum ochraceum]